MVYLITRGVGADEAEGMLGPALHQLLQTLSMFGAMIHLPTGHCAALLLLMIGLASGTVAAIRRLHRRPLGRW